MRWLALLALPFGLAGCDAGTDSRPPATAAATSELDVPIDGLPESLVQRFEDGKERFQHVFEASEGLGPVFINHACASCHEHAGKGPGAATKMVKVTDDGATPADDQSAFLHGHTLRPHVAGPGTLGIEVPSKVPNVKMTQRIGPAVFGRGYMEAVADAEIERVAAAQAQRTDGISGRINRVAWGSERNPGQRIHDHRPGATGLIGRFGLKAQVATIDDFTAGAFLLDMGLTSPLRPAELPNPDDLADDDRVGVDVSAEVVNVVSDYARLLRLPPRGPLNARGQAAFEAALCHVCHVPSLRTREDYPIAALAGIDAPLYTDLLVHDMGVALSDGLQEGDASWREWRTAPLVGLRFFAARGYLHDGRAPTVADAIEAHDGEAAGSRAAYRALSDADRAALLELVSAL